MIEYYDLTKVFVNKEDDGGEEVEIVLPCAGLISDIVQPSMTGPVLDIIRVGRSNEGGGGGEEIPLTRPVAERPTGRSRK